MTAQWPREKLQDELKQKSFEEWARESSKHAYEVSYDLLNLHNNDTITTEYEQKARLLIDHQIALGGYRLADALTEMLGGKSTTFTEQKFDGIDN